MNKDIELRIKMDYVRTKANDLMKIFTSLSSSKITYKIDSSKGEMANEVNTLINEVNRLSDDISELLQDVTKSVANIATSFDKADAKMSDLIDSVGEEK